MEMTASQRAAFEAGLAEAARKNKKAAETPKQRVRTMAQGATFGFADELEARARSLATGRPYQEVVDEVRGGLKAYKEAYPKSSMAYEIGGAALPALIPGGQASLGRAAARAGAEGAAYAFGTGEGSARERAERLPTGIAYGTLGGTAGYGLAKGIGGLANKLADAARRKVGGRGATIVENEIQRLVTQTGKTPDEITQDIIDGRLLAENRTIQAAVRSLRTGGGEASTIIQEGLIERPAQTRQAAMAEMRGYLGDAGEGSQVTARRASDESTAAAEKAAYSGLDDVDLPDQALSALANTLKRVPSAAKEVAIMLRAQTGKAPFFEIADDGAVSFTRRPTVMEAESVRRAVGNRATSLYRQEGMGGAGEAVADVQKGLREVLDFSIPELASTRAQAAAIRANRDAYTAGAKAMAGDVNEKLADFEALASGDNAAEAVASFRAGFMKALEGRAATGSRQSMIRNLIDPNSKEGKILLQVFPQDQLDDVLKTLDIAADAQAAAGKIGIGTGSQTAEDAAEAARRGMGITASDMGSVLSGNPIEAIGVVDKFIRGMSRTKLTDAENARIAKVLVSNDPDLVRRAMVDESGMQALANAVERMAVALKGVGRKAGATLSQQVPEPLRIDIPLPEDQ
tara:strand:- start:1745 stop:3637 length:1893 start_codon:yes stop_codon:yes gene_type:complete